MITLNEKGGGKALIVVFMMVCLLITIYKERNSWFFIRQHVKEIENSITNHPSEWSGPYYRKLIGQPYNASVHHVSGLKIWQPSDPFILDLWPTRDAFTFPERIKLWLAFRPFINKLKLENEKNIAQKIHKWSNAAIARNE